MYTWNAMLKRYSIAGARNQLPAVIHAVENGEPVEITRRGEPVAVLVSRARFQQMSQPAPDLWAAYQQWRRDHEGVLDDADIDALVDPERGEDPPPRVTW